MKKNNESRLKQYRTEIELFLRERGEAAYISPVSYRNWKIVFKDFLPKLQEGYLLDIGSANALYKSELDAQKYKTFFLDIKYFPKANDVQGDVHALPFNDESFNSVLCLQLFEHLSMPFIAIKEVSRVLKKDGILILSVPHLSRLHEIPNDYYRYTEYGLKQLLEQEKLQIMDSQVTGGLLLFLGHQYSLIFLLSLWKIRFARPLLVWINRYFIIKPLLWLDSFFIKQTRFPQGYVIMAKKL
ncbi:MAG: class I SAM-dependent methyltransferase [Anaerolineaceae bacterium]|nr:class I SAM-dependent methyltransferase [Anaerolineaceae bacterium]